MNIAGGHMAKLEIISIEEAKGMKARKARESKVLEMYKGYIEKLSPKEAGRLKIKDDKEGFAFRVGLKRASKALDVKIKVQKRNDCIVFWKE
jgi:hypothetical protein